MNDNRNDLVVEKYNMGACECVVWTKDNISECQTVIFFFNKSTYTDDMRLFVYSFDLCLIDVEGKII